MFHHHHGLRATRSSARTRFAGRSVLSLLRGASVAALPWHAEGRLSAEHKGNGEVDGT